jgi:hypothetical protein
VLAAPLERTNGELADEKKWVEYTGMDRTALISKGNKKMRGLRETAHSLAAFYSGWSPVLV